MPTKKIAKKFKDKKQLLKFVEEIDSHFDFVDLYLQHQEKIEDIAWSEKYIDDCIGSYKNQVSTGNSNIQGAVALDKNLIEKTSWRLMSHGASLGFFFGIAQIPKDKKSGSMYGFNSHKSGLEQGYYLLSQYQAYSDYYEEDNKQTNFRMDNQEWITLTYDPDANVLQFFNQDTKNSYELKIKPKQEDVNYYPVVVLYKATVYQNYFDDSIPGQQEYYAQQEQEQEQEQEREHNLQTQDDLDP